MSSILTNHPEPHCPPRAKLIAFHLPQYHPIPENDEWWGKGFTEWTNVARARPRFRGHYQPHLPADLGFYDLRLPETRDAQATLAEQYGIHGFCYYHYWFHGRRILNRPIDDLLGSRLPAYPFCLCWANEHWTRTWYGDSQVIVPQRYSVDDDRSHIRWLLNAFADDRYIRVGSKPLFLVYRANQLPDPLRTTELWRDEARRAGLGDLYLCKVEADATDRCTPSQQGFDAAIEFAPDWGCLPPTLNYARIRIALRRLRLTRSKVHYTYDYRKLIDNMLAKPKPGYVRHPCVTPGWDNSARRGDHAVVFVNSTPEQYRSWLEKVMTRYSAHDSTPGLVFINAWNEWGEGCHLEPDARYGHAYLEATKAAVTHSASHYSASAEREAAKRASLQMPCS